jgi:uncharacterized membrane protein SpoIIM required for sporulation
MLESLIKYNEIERRPWITFLWALLISSVGILFSIQLSYQIQVSGNLINLTGLFSVIFTIIPSVYFLTMFIKKQESMDERDIERHYEKGFWARHDKDVLIFLFYFFGLTFSFAFWAYALPAGTFQIQTMKIQEIRTLAGNMLVGSASGSEISSFTRVLFNNLQVMAFAFIFSLLFGAGAVFIVVWNASILGVYIGRLSESILHIPGVSLSFLPHGIPEIAGYLLAGLAGGIISAAVIRGHKKDIVFGVTRDAMKLLGMALLFVFLGALIETMDIIGKLISIFVFYTIFIYIITIAITPSNNNGREKKR